MRRLGSLSFAGVACFLLAFSAGAVGSTRSSHNWTRVELGAVSQPAPVGGRFVLYAHHAGSLQVVALNARDGSTAWIAGASPSDVTAGVSASLAVNDRAVFFFEAAAGSVGTARLVGREVASGRRSGNPRLASFPRGPTFAPMRRPRSA